MHRYVGVNIHVVSIVPESDHRPVRIVLVAQRTTGPRFQHDMPAVGSRFEPKPPSVRAGTDLALISLLWCTEGADSVKSRRREPGNQSEVFHPLLTPPATLTTLGWSARFSCHSQPQPILNRLELFRRSEESAFLIARLKTHPRATYRTCFSPAKSIDPPQAYLRRVRKRSSGS
ncbi:hypothetical protein BDD14_2237 [Edaphobacter modestus]|uniref:Uncharacterized protein n=1 Tax=Edaphobacter modestus TaxID=388466 RepID=A0A4Q7YUH9_9BACT|nr:hypothetical protein BDD14_2237 [Edaphobacter modestus]